MFIAEIGINHDGDIYKALKLIKIAKESGADVVKFQKRNVEKYVPKEKWDEVKITRWGELKYIDYKKRIEFGKQEYDIIDKYCKELDIIWTVSVWDIDSYNFISQYDVPFIKIASPTITNLELLRKIEFPVIYSTGMSNSKEVDLAHKNIEKCIGILHCVSIYPPRDKELNLNNIKSLKIKYKCRIGYSSHYEGVEDVLVAKSLGAEIFEKHITLDKNDIGSDHKFSLEPKELKKCISLINKYDRWIGDKEIRVLSREEKFRKKLRNN